MDYEKKYKEVLEKIQWTINNAKKQGHIIVRVEDIENSFHELRESENERIIKELSALVIWASAYSASGISDVDAKAMLAWLEKQDEQKDAFSIPTRENILAIWDLGNEWKELTQGSISTEYGTQLEYIQKHWKESEYYLNKQGEQKETLCDKCKKEQPSHSCQDITALGRCYIENINTSNKIVEPKFKVGDSIKTTNEEPLTISKINDKGYWSEDLFICGFDEENIWDLVEQKPTKWSEEDERALKGIIGLVDHNQHYGVSNKEMLDWLKSLKERIGE